jgi:hypothetical protein
MAKDTYVEEPLPLFGEKKSDPASVIGDQEKNGAAATHVASAGTPSKSNVQGRGASEGVLVITCCPLSLSNPLLTISVFFIG